LRGKRTKKVSKNYNQNPIIDGKKEREREREPLALQV